MKCNRGEFLKTSGCIIAGLVLSPVRKLLSGAEYTLNDVRRGTDPRTYFSEKETYLPNVAGGIRSGVLKGVRFQPTDLEMESMMEMHINQWDSKGAF